ncbi:MAG TPA: glycosyltransferase family 4 protein [Candidatus Polarisedimenticolia bacterium]|jgi:glycosyltransferase involved in cell wall biosynthesis|nr:glycosyltransferase family 4 protein [Candidatus Polarisedimenticolia bacterium]
MRVALIAPGPGSLGGQEVQAAALQDRLREEGHQVTRIPIDPRSPRPLSWVRRLPYVRTLVNQAIYIPSLARLRGVDVVHIFSASFWSFLLAPAPAIAVSRLFGKRVVLHYHSGEAESHLARWGMLVHPFLRLVDDIVVPSEYLREVFARHGHRARVIRNIVDTGRFRYRERPPLRPRFLSARSLEPHYRVEVTIRAFSRLKKSYPEATLTVAGSGSQEKYLRGLVAALGAEGVRFAGAVDPRRMPELYEEADILLNASVVDNQPVSVLEAFAAGLPVVSTAAGDLANLIRHRTTGLLVPREDPGAMVDAASYLLGNPNRALLIARGARREAEKYRWESVRSSWLAVYAGRPS